VDLSNLPYLFFSLLNSLFVAAMLTILWMLASAALRGLYAAPPASK